jgi:hypothetical protein
MRVPLSNLGSVRIVDATAKRKGVLLQNVDATNIALISEDQRSLDSLDASGNPTAGFTLPNNMAQPIAITAFRGALYARAKAGTVQLEVYEYDVDDEAIPVTGLERMNRRRFPYVNKG